MSRTEKLFQRLDQLEAEYRDLAAYEFAKLVYGGSSLFLADRIPYLFVLRYPSAAQIELRDHLKWLEKEIEALRLKLDQPMSESPISVVHDAAARICAANESAEGTELMIAKTLLKEWGCDYWAEKR